MMKVRSHFIVAVSERSPHNNSAGADCWEILVVLQRLLAAAQPERYAAQIDEVDN